MFVLRCGFGAGQFAQPLCHGQELAALGVNLNLAPVLDLRPELKRNRFDFNTLIGQRAISDDPAIVADIARAYVNGLEASGVGATVKHFPGLGRVRSDTHHFSADLDTPLDELEASDWIPFRKVLAGSKAQLMIGHVTLTSVDPDRPASHSKRVIDGIVRKKWNFQGVVMRFRATGRRPGAGRARSTRRGKMSMAGRAAN